MRKRKQEPVRLEKKERSKYDYTLNIPLEYILIAIILIIFFVLILNMGPTTESGLVYNGKLA